MTPDALTPTRRILVLVLIAGVFIMDGYDLNAMALAYQRFDGTLVLSDRYYGWLISAPLLGLGAGGALIAPMGDRFGRKALITLGCLAVALVTFATTFATSFGSFLLWRFLTGVALGACLPNCTALSAELAPPRLRATIMSIVSAGIVLGAMSAGLSSPAISASIGWKGMFYAPAAFALLVAALLWFAIPAGLAKPEAPAKASRIPQALLFRKPWLFPFSIFALALGLNAANLYLVTQWAPKLLPTVGFTQDQADYVTGLMQGVGLAFGFAMSLLIDRWRPGVTLVAGFAVMTAAFVAIMATPDADPTLWTILLLVGVGTITGMGMALPALTAYLFPGHVLSSAMGVGVAIARVGAIGGPIIGQQLFNAEVGASVIIGFAAIPAAIGMLVAFGVPAALRVRKRLEGEAGPAKP